MTPPLAETPTPAARAPADLTRTIQAVLASPSYRPPLLPAVALEVMQLARSPEVEIADLVDVLERDPVLAARVLGIAQSARYARRSPVMSLRQAAVRLGLETLNELVLQAALELKVFRAPGFEWFAARLNAHATAAAHVVKDVCRRAGIAADHAFICGLLHDIGLPAALLIALEQPDAAGARFEAIAPVLDAVHADASGVLARLWRLPQPIADVLATHHDVEVDGAVRPVNAALVVAEQLCWEAGAGVLPPPPGADPTALELPDQPLDGIDANWSNVVRRALAAIGFDARAMAAARVAAFDVVAALGAAGEPRRPRP